VNDEYIKNKIRERLEVFGAIHCKKTYIEEAFYQLCLDECYHTDSELNADPALINFENGVLNINTLELTPHTPELLSTVQIPCNYAPGLELKDCPTFTQFITRLANYDNDSTAALIEYIGAVISNVDGTRFKKALFLRGAGNCGKSKYIELLRRLLSDEYYATASLEKLESRFGAYSLYNRRLIGDPDIKYLKVSELNTFKQATGGDPLQLEQKGKMPFSFKYSGFMIFGCNELPLFGGDNGKWVYDRMLLIRCGEPVTEQERDPHILEKMYTERAAIVSVAVQYLRACIKRKYRFSEGISSQHLLATYRNDNDPVRAFLAECCLLREEGAPINGDIQQRDFYRAYCNWYDDNGNRSRPSVQQFRRALTHAADVYDIKQLERKSCGKHYYIYTLTEEARQRYAPQSYDYAYHATGL
jgi:P4 family phage/plasmid primase-like protien